MYCSVAILQVPVAAVVLLSILLFSSVFTQLFAFRPDLKNQIGTNLIDLLFSCLSLWHFWAIDCRYGLSDDLIIFDGFKTELLL